MRSLDLPLLVFLLLLPVAVIGFVVWWVIWSAISRKRAAQRSKSCGHCGQRIPDIGGFCPICGQKSAGA